MGLASQRRDDFVDHADPTSQRSEHQKPHLGHTPKLGLYIVLRNKLVTCVCEVVVVVVVVVG